MDYREGISLALAGGVLPVATVVGTFAVMAGAEMPWIVPFLLLFVSPLFAAVGLYVVGVRLDSLRSPSWLPTGRTRTFGDEIPARYREEFGAETLGAAAEQPNGATGALLALGIVYLVSIPVYAVVLWTLFG